MKKYAYIENNDHVVRIIIFVLAAILTLSLTVALTGCSSSSSSSGQSGKSSSKQTVNGYSVSEYNADIDDLAATLATAKSLNEQIKSMGNPNSFTSQQQVDRYNKLVDDYNDAANLYNAKARAFSSKYGTTIDGAGSKSADPDQIDLPKKK